ncbi:hypothetical protein C0989_010386 [Termitomyces sp. Mn162]|nr:hypothetical protein C0989_010386 [Termitomyces sp. Mn162]
MNTQGRTLQASCWLTVGIYRPVRYTERVLRSGMKPKQNSLPLELQDRIIDDLKDNRQSLAVCSLVSSQWFKRARKLLFTNFTAYIYLRRGEQAADPRRFLELLEAPHSRLGLSIHRFYIVGPDSFMYLSESNRFFLEDYDALSSLLEAIIPHLPHVRELNLDSMTWNMISQDTRALLGSFREVISLSWIRIYLDCLDDLISFSSENFHGLKAIHVAELRVKNLVQTEQFSRSQHPRRPLFLQDLRLLVEDTTTPLLLALTSDIIPVQHITTLELEVREQDMLVPLGHLIRATAPTLSTLRLHIRLYFEPYQGM